VKVISHASALPSFAFVAFKSYATKYLPVKLMIYGLKSESTS
jgi:hypothetical protein